MTKLRGESGKWSNRSLFRHTKIDPRGTFVGGNIPSLTESDLENEHRSHGLVL